MDIEQGDDNAEKTLTIKYARQLYSRGAFRQAEAACQQLKLRLPENWRLDALLSRIAMDEARLDIAATHIAAAKAHNAPPLPLEKLKLRYARRSKSDTEIMASLDRLQVLEPNNPDWSKQKFQEHVGAGRTDAALRTLKHLFSIAPDVDIRFADIVAFAENAEPDQALRGLSECLELAPGHHILLAARASLYFNRTKTDAGLNDLKNALTKAPEWLFPPRLQKIVQICFSDLGDGVNLLIEFQKAYPRNPSLFWMTAKALDFDGQRERVYAFLDENWEWASQHAVPDWVIILLEKSGAIVENSAGSDMARFKSFSNQNKFEEAESIAESPEQIALFAEASVYPETPDRDIQIFKASRDVVIFGKDRPDGVVLTFHGLAGVPGIHPRLLDRFFRKLGLAHISLSDPTRMIYLNGVPDLAPGLDETLNTLRDLILTFPGKDRIFTLGNSGGSMAAVCYGEALKAERSVVFAPFATIDIRYKDVIGDKRAGIILRRLTRNLDIERFNLETVLARTATDFRLNSYVNEDDPVGFAHGQMLARMPRVTTKYLTGETKSPLLLACHQFGMMAILRDAFSMPEAA